MTDNKKTISTEEMISTLRKRQPPAVGKLKAEDALEIADRLEELQDAVDGLPVGGDGKPLLIRKTIFDFTLKPDLETVEITKCVILGIELDEDSGPDADSYIITIRTSEGNEYETWNNMCFASRQAVQDWLQGRYPHLLQSEKTEPVKITCDRCERVITDTAEAWPLEDQVVCQLCWESACSTSWWEAVRA